MVSIPGLHPIDASSAAQALPTKRLHKFLKCSHKTPRTSPIHGAASTFCPLWVLSSWATEETLPRKCKWCYKSKTRAPGGFPRNKDLPRVQALGQEKQEEAERTKQPERGRRRGSQGGSWGSQRLQARLQAAGYRQLLAPLQEPECEFSTFV